MAEQIYYKTVNITTLESVSPVVTVGDVSFSYFFRTTSYRVPIILEDGSLDWDNKEIINITDDQESLKSKDKATLIEFFEAEKSVCQDRAAVLQEYIDQLELEV